MTTLSPVKVQVHAGLCERFGCATGAAAGDYPQYVLFRTRNCTGYGGQGSSGRRTLLRSQDLREFYTFVRSALGAELAQKKSPAT